MSNDKGSEDTGAVPVTSTIYHGRSLNPLGPDSGTGLGCNPPMVVDGGELGSTGTE